MRLTPLLTPSPSAKLSSGHGSTATRPTFQLYLADPRLLEPLVAHLDHADWMALYNSSAEFRRLVERDESIKEVIIEHYLGDSGYRSWRREWGAEPIRLSSSVSPFTTTRRSAF
jgi:hypothetical protein